MLPLEDFLATVYKTAAEIKIIHPKFDVVRFAIFDYEIALKSSLANEPPSQARASKRQNIDYFIHFIGTCDVDAE